MRMSRKILEKKLGFLCEKLGKTIGTKKGNWNLDYIQCYGGYIVVEMVNDQGGEHHPLLNKRLTADKMADCLDMALQTLNIKD
jgi:hypothetical protein